MNIFRRGLLAWALALPIWAVLLVMSFSNRSFIQPVSAQDQLPTKPPVAAPTKVPVEPQPTKSPVEAPPTKEPIPPTEVPTKAPTSRPTKPADENTIPSRFGDGVADVATDEDGDPHRSADEAGLAYRLADYATAASHYGDG